MAATTLCLSPPANKKPNPTDSVCPSCSTPHPSEHQQHVPSEVAGITGPGDEMGFPTQMFSRFPAAWTERLTHRHLPAHSQHHGPPFLKPAIPSHPSGCCDYFQQGKSEKYLGGLEPFNKIRQLGTGVSAA